MIDFLKHHNKKNRQQNFLFFIFIFLALFIVFIGLKDSELIKFKKSKAQSFGISPPYIQAFELLPGDMLVQSIRVLRGDDESAQKVQIDLQAPQIANWFELPAGNIVYFAKGQKSVSAQFKILVPPYVLPGDYSGDITFRLQTLHEKGVGVGVGARATIKLTVKENSFKNSKQVVNNDLYSQYKGYVVYTEKEDEFYFIHPKEKIAYQIGLASSSKAEVRLLSKFVSQQDLAGIPFGFLKNVNFIDQDKDGLSDDIEKAIGTNEFIVDTDNDFMNDFLELQNGFDPLKKGAWLPISYRLAEQYKGNFLIDEKNNVWYLSPTDLRRYLLTDSINFNDIFLSLGRMLTDQEFDSLFSGPQESL